MMITGSGINEQGKNVAFTGEFLGMEATCGEPLTVITSAGRYQVERDGADGTDLLNALDKPLHAFDLEAALYAWEEASSDHVPFCEDMEASSKCPICGGTKFVDLGNIQTDTGEYHFAVKCNCENEQ